MKKNILILTSDPESVNYEILKKTKRFFLTKKKNNYTFVGCKKDIFTIFGSLAESLLIENISRKKGISVKKYIKECFEKSFKLLKEKKAHGIINLPLSKKHLPKNYPGVTEYIADSFKKYGQETMLLYSDRFSVCPNTIHIPLALASKSLKIKNIIKNAKNINSFYLKIIGIKKPTIGIMGFNPHNGADFKKKLEEKKKIIPSIKTINRQNIKIIGPLAPDSAFNSIKEKNLHCLMGNYHDQVLPTFKYINKFNAINITLGLPFLRISPDHGPAVDIKGKNLANPNSFLCALNFFEKYHKKI